MTGIKRFLMAVVFIGGGVLPLCCCAEWRGAFKLELWGQEYLIGNIFLLGNADCLPKEPH